MKGIFDALSREVESCDIIVVGHLKWNPYFGESADAPPRGDPSTCTSTLVRGRDKEGNPFALLVDPTLRLSAEDYYFDLNRRTGLHPQDITHCFSTHAHFDHQVGLNYFPNAVWCAAKPVAEELRDSQFIDGSRVQGVEGEFLPGVAALPLPGHTPNLHGIACLCGGFRILIAGDGVMTRDHFREDTTQFGQDAKTAAHTIRKIKEAVDLVIPGHDNVIVQLRGR